MTTPTVINVPLDCALDGAYRDHVAVMGNMDGVHQGHQALIAHARTMAKKLNKPLGAIIFDPHPRQAFSPDSAPFALSSKEQKIELLGKHGVNTVFVLPFNRHLSMLEPNEFVQRILSQNMGLAGILVGEEFCFGRRRSGNTDMLKKLATSENMAVEIIRPVTLEGAEEKFSSSQAREALRNGQPELAQKILGRPWTVTGMVQKGQQLGRTLNFPTANISLGQYLHPAKGVYAVKAIVQGESRNGVANFGSRPTVDGKNVLLEVFLFDFDKEIYGEIISVEFHHFIRAEKKFDGLDALKAQIAKDGEEAARLLA